MNFAQRFNDLIEDGNYQVDELANLIGVTRQQIRRWRNGTSEPGIYKIETICRLYKVSADYLLGLPKGLHWPR